LGSLYPYGQIIWVQYSVLYVSTSFGIFFVPPRLPSLYNYDESRITIYDI
jgi:hypothetical protein